MKRYIAFTGEYYYPSGGAKELVCFGDTLEDCHAGILKATKEQARDMRGDIEDNIKWIHDSEWAHIYDCQKKEIVWERFDKAYGI